MAKKRFTDPLSMDITDDLERVDGVVTNILKDRALWSEFLQDPNGVLISLGLHPPTTPEINERVNRIFYATLTYKKLLQILLKHYKKFRPSKMKKFKDRYVAGLKKGVIQHDIELDLEGVHHLLQDSKMLSEVLKLSLQNLNRKRLLQKYHKPKEIDNYVDRVVEAVKARQPIEAHPKLEVWDTNYGIGQAFGGLLAEAGILVTVTGVVEASALVTAGVLAVAHSAVAVEVDIVVDGTIATLISAAGEGDKDSIRAVAILGRLLDFSGELLIHAHNFEKGSS